VVESNNTPRIGRGKEPESSDDSFSRRVFSMSLSMGLFNPCGALIMSRVFVTASPGKKNKNLYPGTFQGVATDT
jgi:hypothetical protein